MAHSSYLRLSRNNIYVFRRRIPKSLLQFFKTNELRISTSTRDIKIAIYMARNMANESDLMFEHLMNHNDMAENKENDALKEKIKSLEKELKFNGLKKTIEFWTESNFLKTRLEQEADLRLQEIVQNNQRTRDLEANYKSGLNQQEGAFKSALDAVTLALKRQENNLALAPKNDLKLSELVNDYFSKESLERRNIKASTVRKDRDGLKLFLEIVGDKYISQVSQADAVVFADSCPMYGRKNGVKRAVSTVNGYLNAVGSFSGWITSIHSEQGHVEFNFSKLRSKRALPSSKERLEFTIEEVKRILSHPDLISFKNAEPVKYWLPFIAAYSGARLEEIVQLSPMTDIYEADGIWVMDINDRDGRTVKTLSSIRRVPIHSELIKNGLLEYVENLKSKHATTLFPDEKERDGRIGKNAGKRVNRFIQKVVGIEKKSLHCFRHTFVTFLKRSLVVESIAAEIVGQSHGGITYDRYGKGYLSDTLKNAVELINFE